MLQCGKMFDRTTQIGAHPQWGMAASFNFSFVFFPSVSDYI